MPPGGSSEQGGDEEAPPLPRPAGRSGASRGALGGRDPLQPGVRLLQCRVWAPRRRFRGAHLLWEGLPPQIQSCQHLGRQLWRRRQLPMAANRRRRLEGCADGQPGAARARRGVERVGKGACLLSWRRWAAGGSSWGPAARLALETAARQLLQAVALPSAAWNRGLLARGGVWIGGGLQHSGGTETSRYVQGRRRPRRRVQRQHRRRPNSLPSRPDREATPLHLPACSCGGCCFPGGCWGCWQLPRSPRRASWSTPPCQRASTAALDGSALGGRPSTVSVHSL